jgi:hypothetical protein
MKDHPPINRYTSIADIDCKAVDRSHAASCLTIMGAIIWWQTFKFLQGNMDKSIPQSSFGSSRRAPIRSENLTTQCYENQPTEKRMQLMGPDNFADEVVSARGNSSNDDVKAI